MIKSFTSAVAVAALGMTLFTGGVASAVEKPVKGTSDCTALVESNPAVTSAAKTLATARDDLATAQNSGIATTAQINKLNDDVEQAVRLLTLARVNTTSLLCKNGPVTTEPKPTTVAPAPTTVVQNPTTVVERPTVIDRERISTVAVVPTHDDGSVASTSGSQITVVPEGSASTGQA